MQHTRPAATTPQARAAATNLTGPAAPSFSCACARGNELMQRSRLAATLRVVDRARARVGPGTAKVVQIRKSVNL